MRYLFLFIFATQIYAFDLVVKYAVNDKKLINNAHKTAEVLKKQNIHFGVIENSEMFVADGGLTALKMGYIELYSANATELQYIIKSIWPKLEKAKNGDQSLIRSDLENFGFTLINIKYLDKKTLLILGNKKFFDRSDNSLLTTLQNGL